MHMVFFIVGELGNTFAKHWGKVHNYVSLITPIDPTDFHPSCGISPGFCQNSPNKFLSKFLTGTPTQSCS